MSCQLRSEQFHGRCIVGLRFHLNPVSLIPSVQLVSNPFHVYALYLMYLVRNRRWKSLRMVSFTNLFFVSGSVLACPLKTTSSFHLAVQNNTHSSSGCKLPGRGKQKKTSTPGAKSPELCSQHESNSLVYFRCRNFFERQVLTFFSPESCCYSE